MYGFYSMQAKMRPIEGCEAPRVNGALIPVRPAQANRENNTTSIYNHIASTSIHGVPAAQGWKG